MNFSVLNKFLSFVFFIAIAFQNSHAETQSVLDDSLNVIIESTKKHSQQNPALCESLPAKYNKFENKVRQIKNKENYKFLAGIITGIYRYTALRTNCNLDFLDKNPSIFNKNLKTDQSEYNGPGKFYFLQGELFGFLAEGLRLNNPELNYTEAISLVYANQLSFSLEHNVDKKILAKLLTMVGSMKEERDFTDYGLPLK